MAHERSSPPTDAYVVALVSDLVFQTKITATAARLGIAIRVVHTVADLCEVAQRASRLLVDLNLSPDDALDAIRRTRSEFPQLPIVAFCSHVQTERIAQAKQAGAHEVMPRSAFSEQLPQILSRA